MNDMKYVIAILLFWCAIAMAEKPSIPPNLSFVESLKYSTAWWDSHDCFSNEQIKAATDLIKWQQQRIAFLEQQLAAK